LYPRQPGTVASKWINCTRPIIDDTPPSAGERKTGWAHLGRACGRYKIEEEFELPNDAEDAENLPAWDLLTAQQKAIWGAAIASSYWPDPPVPEKAEHAMLGDYDSNFPR
jgi:hypothetical protein